LGEQSDLVKKYQQILINLGYLEGEADGNFGLGTQNAIKAFQSRNDQVVDGYLGPDTRAALDDPNAVPFAMRLGEQSDSVRELQEYLVKYGYLDSDKATGYFGELTKTAVANFQSKNGLTADGLAGGKTMSLLYSGNVKKNTKTSSTGSTSQSSAGTTGNTSSSASSGTGSSSSSAAQVPQTSYVGSGGATVSGSAANLIAIASSKIGCPYVWGAKGPNSFDCSGFVYWCLNQAGVGVSYMTSSGWRNPGRFKQVSYNELQAGDIIVVSGHVGIVAGGGTIIDASSSNGRVVHRNLGAWWANHFICGWRIFS
jgi:peptidoglycan hydrolase-like protein with peptidoglycan-binding domain